MNAASSPSSAARGFPLRQHGVALLSALLVVALATIVTVAMTRERLLSVQRSANLMYGEQAWQYALGLEAWARSLLHQDRVSEDRMDTRTEAWAGRLPLIPVPGGRLTGDLDDLDGRFNVNTLLGSHGEIQLRRFRRLLGVLGLDPLLAARLQDWLDADREARTGGAEDYAYTGLKPAYRAGNQPLAHISELRLILGLDQAGWELLAPHVSALPDRNATINVNTATVPVLMSLHAQISQEMAVSLAQAGRAGFTTVQEFSDSRILQGLVVPTDGLAVQSDYFLAHGVVELDDSVYHFYSLIRRPAGGSMVVLRRSRGVS